MSALALHLLFALGGGLGAVARFALTLKLTHRYPLSTLLVNVIGCFILGVLLARFSSITGPGAEQSLRLYAGFCGGFTTFSSFAYQSLDLHRKHSLAHAAINVVANVLFCIAAFLLGRSLGG